jgi:hypothetical protein
MRYSTENMQVSLTKQLAKYLKASGYSIFWHSGGILEAHTSTLTQPRGIITLVPEFPATPTSIKRLNSGEAHSSLKPDQIAVPVLTLSVGKLPKKLRRLGLGMSEHEYEREFMVDGLAASKRQHRHLADTLYRWLGMGDVLLECYDFDTDPTDPPLMEPMTVQWADVIKPEMSHENPAIRFYVNAKAAVKYSE